MIYAVTKEEIKLKDEFYRDLNISLLVDYELLTKEQAETMMFALTKCMNMGINKSRQSITDSIESFIYSQLFIKEFGFKEDKSSAIVEYLISMFNINVIKISEQNQA